MLGSKCVVVGPIIVECASLAARIPRSARHSYTAPLFNDCGLESHGFWPTSHPSLPQSVDQCQQCLVQYRSTKKAANNDAGDLHIFVFCIFLLPTRAQHSRWKARGEPGLKEARPEERQHSSSKHSRNFASALAV